MFDKNSEIQVGALKELGRYPQSIVTDNNTVEALKIICESPKSGALWKDYDYITGRGMYADLDYMNKRYRLVNKQKHREDKFMYGFSDYPDGNIYAFLYEPIKWRVLKISNGNALLASEKILDAQEFYVGENRKFDSAVIYKNNYEYSYVRKWLNSVFFETAFNDEEKAVIQTAAVRNSSDTTKNENNPYVCNDTSDKVFLLSFEEAKTLYSDNKDRQKKVTEYTKSQGCYFYKTRDAKYNNSTWWLRSPDHKYEDCVRCVGDGGGLGDGGFSCSNEPVDSLEAIAPAIILKLQ